LAPTLTLLTGETTRDLIASVAGEGGDADGRAHSTPRVVS
jgi:hypothetical protein